MKKDKQFKELLELNEELIKLGDDLVISIQEYGAYHRQNLGKSPHMVDAVSNWLAFVEKNFTKIPSENKKMGCNHPGKICEA